MTDLGTITAQGTTRTVRFERTLAFSAETVWAALTEPDQLREWLTDAVVRPGQGGEIALDFGEDGKESGQITAWDPPRVLAYEWGFAGEGAPSHVRFELDVLDEGAATRLTLEHTLLAADKTAGYGAGWHAHLDQLEGFLEGDAGAWQERFEAFLPRYRESAASLS
jgi:uncharacterized protein YndB with AHSA1/START domain